MFKRQLGQSSKRFLLALVFFIAFCTYLHQMSHLQNEQPFIKDEVPPAIGAYRLMRKDFNAPSSNFVSKATVKTPVNIKTYINPNAVALLDLQTEGNVGETCQLNFDCNIVKFTSQSNLSFSEFDAVIGMSKHDLMQNESRNRPSGQIWVMANVESKIVDYVFYDIDPIKSSFNWSYHMSKKADIYRPHFYLRKVKEDNVEVYPNEAKKKREFCWIFSNCVDRSGRVESVLELAKHLPAPIHWYGGADACIPKNYTNIIPYGTFPGRYRSYYKHKEMIEDCIFYLSLESYICEDYITEKFVNPISIGAIPLVNGWKDAYREMAPPGSYIHIFDYDNFTQLGQQLSHLLRNKEELLKYHEWRREFKVEGLETQPICDLCQRVQEERKNPHVRTVQDIKQKMANDQQCLLPDRNMLKRKDITLTEKMINMKELFETNFD